MTDSKNPVTGWLTVKDILHLVVGVGLTVGAVCSFVVAWGSKGAARPLWLIVALLFLVLGELRERRLNDE